MDENKKRALDAAILKIEKDFGKGAVMRLGDPNAMGNVEVVPTGALSLDIALGLGGIPKGRVVEVYGPESSGKTTVSLHMIAEVQKRSGIAAFIDAEHALVPKAEIDGEMGDAHIGLQARLMSQALRKLTPVVSKSKCIVIFINQLREKIGIMFGNPEVTTGGRALKFYSSVRLDVRRIDMIKAGGERVGNRTRVKIVKNKIAPPFKEAEFDIMYGTGISREGDILDLAAEINVINKSGSWYSYEGMKLAQGREASKEYLKEHPDFMAEVEQKVREHYHLQTDESGNVVATVTVTEENFETVPETILKELENDEAITIDECAKD